MPNYASSNQAQLLYENTQQFFWNNEPVAANSLSIAWEIYRVSRSFYPWGLSVEVTFPSAPGTFEIDVMAANTDSKTSFVSIGTITAVNTSVLGGFVGRFDMPTNIWPKYVALFVKTLTGSINISAAVTR